MIDALAGFFDALRARGVGVAPAEAIDAVKALASVGIESREGVRAALRVACAKDRREAAAFDEAFERYFATLARRGRDGAEAGGAPGAGSGRGGESHGSRRPPPRPEPRRDQAEPGRRTVPRARRGAPRAADTSFREAPLAELRRLAGGREARLRRLDLDRARAASVEPREAARLELRGRLPEPAERQLLAEAARLASLLRLRRSRRLEAGRSGRLGLKRTLRRSLRTGGVPFRIDLDQRRRRRPRLVLLLDVSRSVARASGLFLVLAASLLAEVARVQVFAFVDRPVECTRALLAWARGGHPASTGPGRVLTFAGALGSVAGIDLAAASDYGRVFWTLATERRLRGGRDLVLAVLGDGRSNRFDPQAWAFSDLARRARAVVWLVPERTAEWGTGDSALLAYLPEVDVAVESARLEGLVRGLRALLRRMPS